MLLFLILSLLLAAALAVLLWPLRAQPKTAAAIAACFAATAFGLYGALGEPRLVPLLERHEARINELKETIVRRLEDVRQNKKNLGAWIELGQAFMESGQYKAAAGAFKEATLLSQGNPLILLAYASAQISEAEGTITDGAKKSLEMVLLQQPDNPEARYLLAVRTLQDGKHEEAMKTMKALYRSLPEDAPLRKMIDQQIGR